MFKGELRFRFDLELPDDEIVRAVSIQAIGSRRASLLTEYIVRGP